MSDLFREVNEEVRQEQIIQFFKRYGVQLIGGIVAAILLLVGYNYWQDQQDAEREALSERFEVAVSLLSGGKPVEAADEFEALTADAGPSGYGLLAGFRGAEALAQAGDAAGAVAAYDAIADSSGVERFFRDLAAIFAANLLVDTAGTDEIQDRLVDVSGEGNPLRYSALELIATSQYGVGRLREAESLFVQIADEASVTSGVRIRALQMLTIIRQGQPVQPEPAEQGEHNDGEGE